MDNGKNYKLGKCLIFVKKNFPEQDEDTQYLMAEACYLVSETIFKEVVPAVVSRNLAHSDN